MKFIEIDAHNRTYFINPAQITHTEGKQEGDTVYITVYLTVIDSNKKAESITFHKDDAVRMFRALRETH